MMGAAERRNLRCATRALKNARFIQANAPDIIPQPEPPEGFSSIIPFNILERIHLRENLFWHDDAQRLERMQRLTFPTVGAEAVDPLLQGVLLFARLVAAIRPQNSIITMSDADVATALNYAVKASGPISQYAAQYGRNSIAVSTLVVPIFVQLDVPSYSDAQLQTWVNQVAFSTACVVVLNPLGLLNTDADPAKGIGGYHSKANVPYIFVNVLGQNLTLADEGFFYAGSLSHEIAEMAVDPLVDGRNPEVCDPCGPNCVSTFLDYFDSGGNYIATSQAFPPPFTYSFFINGIVASPFATQCPAPAKACNYPPGSPPPAEKGDKDRKDTKDRKDIKEGAKEKDKDAKEKDRDQSGIGVSDQIAGMATQLQGTADNVVGEEGHDEAFITPQERPDVG